MGLTASTATGPPQKSRLEYLGDRYPFGDAEIIRLARCHAYLRRGRRIRKSFLSDWAVYCVSLHQQGGGGGGGGGAVQPELPPGGTTRPRSESELDDDMHHPVHSVQHLRQRRAALMQLLEGRILPSGFGRRLERAAFLLSTDVVDYRTSSMMDSPPTPEDPYRGPSSVGTNGGGNDSPHNIALPCQPCWSPGGKPGGQHRQKQQQHHPPYPTTTNGYGTDSSYLTGNGDEYNDAAADYANPLAGTDLHDTSFQRLEKFMEGASDCCRRGPRPALTVLFKSCSRNSRGGYTSDMRFGTTAGVSDANLDASGFEGGSGGFGGTAGSSSTDPSTIRANANEVLDLGYSLALASAFLSIAAQVDNLQELDANAYIPEDLGFATSNSLLGYAKKIKRDFRAHMAESPAVSGELDLDPYTGKAMANALPTSSQYSERSTGADSISSTSTHVHGNENLVTLDVFLEWAEQTAPCLSACLSTFLHHVLFPDKPYPPSRTPFLHPDLVGQRSAFFDAPSSPLLFSLACMSPALGGTWHRLYTSESDGLSFNRLFACLLGYGGPTVLIIREAEGGGIFGAFTGTAWKESKDFYGNSDCFLFQVSPTVGVYRPRGRDKNFMYCNSVSRSKGYDGLAHGIGFGGTDELPRLFIAETFDGCVASSADLTFESGPLLPPAKEGGSRKYFDICDLEVWGVGGDAAVASGLDARKAQRALLDANIQKARKVDKAQFLDDFKSGLIESKAFKHRTEARGRHHFEADEKSSGYKIPGDKRGGSTTAPTRTIPGTGL